MGIFGHEHYVPILLVKQGEQKALSTLSAAIKSAFTPLLVVPPVAWDYEEEAPSKTVEQHLAKLPQQLITAWGTARAFVDLQFIEDTPIPPTGEHPLEWVTREAGSRGLPLVPVTSINRSTDYREAAARTVSRDERGACVRLTIEEWPTNTGPVALDDLLTQLAVAATDVDLVLDLGEEIGPLALTALRNELTTLPHLADWRSLTVAGAGMPKASPPGKLTHHVPRGDWLLWKDLVTGPVLPQRLPTFGDYAIAHPDPTVDVDPRALSISATLRYTCADEWLMPKGDLYKGNGGKGKGGAAMFPVAAALLAESNFTGGHCEFEDWIAFTAGGGGSGGNPTVWRRYGTHHHLRFVTEQLASANPVSSSTP